MKTRAEAESRLAKCALLRPVAVADVADEERGARRAYHFTNADQTETTVEIDADPSPRQLADLATHLPVPEDKRMAALAIMAEQAPNRVATVAKGVGLVSVGAAILELVHQLGVIP